MSNPDVEEHPSGRPDFPGGLHLQVWPLGQSGEVRSTAVPSTWPSLHHTAWLEGGPAVPWGRVAECLLEGVVLDIDCSRQTACRDHKEGGSRVILMATHGVGTSALMWRRSGGERSGEGGGGLGLQTVTAEVMMGGG